MLQGSLDNFALDEVLGLLSSTAKTGRLSLDGDRGRGTLTLVDGRLVDATASGTRNDVAPEDVVFELLRYVDGSFSFDVCPVEGGDDGRDVADVLAAAEGRLADWRTIEAVVPSVDHVVAPVESLPAEEVTVSRAEWATLRIIAAGCPVSVVCDGLGLGEVEGSRQVKTLAERGLVVVSPPQHGAVAQPSAPTTVGTAGASEGVRVAVGSAPIPDRPLPPADPDEPTGPDTITAGPVETLQPPNPDAEVAAGEHPADDGQHPPVDRGAVDDPGAELEWSGAEEDAAPRPPMPAPPSLDEIHQLVDGDAEPAPPGPGDAVAANGDTNSTGHGADRDSESKPGGLLMRYLKSED